MSTHPEIAHLPKDERIRAIAYFIWEEEGCPDGRDLEHWARASELVEAEATDTTDPNWLQRAEPEATPETTAPEGKRASLDDLVKRMKGARAA